MPLSLILGEIASVAFIVVVLVFGTVYFVKRRKKFLQMQDELAHLIAKSKKQELTEDELYHMEVLKNKVQNIRDSVYTSALSSRNRRF